MAYLLITEPSGEEFKQPLKGNTVTIGRVPSCDLALNHPQVSREHARLFRRGASYWLEDLGSANGTLLNGERVGEPVALRPGSKILLGAHVIHYHAAATESQVTYALVGRGGVVDDQTFFLPHGEISIGRDDDNAIVLQDSSISRHHALLRVRSGGVMAIDLGSRNGIRINGERKPQCTLRVADVVRIGSVEFQFAATGRLEKKSAVAQIAARFRSYDTGMRVSIVALGFACILLSASTALVIRGQAQRANVPEEGFGLGDRYQAELTRSLGNGRKLLQREQWRAATEVLAVVLDQDPINVEARSGVRSAKANLVDLQIVEKAETKLQKGHPVAAKDLLAKLGPKSHYFAKTTALRRRVDVAVVSAAVATARDACVNRNWPTCQTAAQRALKIDPNDTAAQRLRDEAKKQQRRP